MDMKLSDQTTESTSDTSVNSCSVENLEALFAEVTSVSLRIRQVYGDTQVPGGVPAGCKTVLAALEHQGPKTVPQLARMRGTSRQNIQVLVNRLHRDGHVQLVPNAAHKRSSFFQVTKAGIASLEKLEQAEVQLTGALAPRLGQEQVVAAIGVLKQLRELLAVTQITTARLPEQGLGQRETSPARKQMPVLVEEDLPISLL
jgi:DNA-binding MarR family transcriptional regulator